MRTTSAIRANREHIERFYDYLNYSPYGISEIRVIDPNARRIIQIGYFDNRDDFIQACMDVNYANIYASLNPVPIEFLNRAYDLLRPAGEIRNTVRDKDIEYATNIMLDIDPIRPTGTASTNDEIELAINKAYEVAQYLIEHDLCNNEQIQLAMSGNGSYILLAIPPIEITDGNRKIIDTRLKAFNYEVRAQFNDDQVEINATTYTLSHLVKVIGTVSIKGDNTPDRPYRVSYPITELIRNESARLKQYILNNA
jgi:hypothetical protein